MGFPEQQAVGKPLLLYDGECRFCCRWVERWKENSGEKIHFAPSQGGAGEEFGFPASEPLGSVQLIESPLVRYSGARAVFRMMELCGGILGKLASRLYDSNKTFRIVTEGVYDIIARHRPFFSALTLIGWGRDVRYPHYTIAPWLFLRLLELCFAGAFVGFWWQVEGLIGPDGILPAGEFLGRAYEVLGAGAIRSFPTIFWVTGCGMTALNLACAAGTIVSLGLLFDFPRHRQGPAFLLLEILYLSLVNIGQVFMGYQWDALLLETGFFAIFLAPWSRNTLAPSLRSKVARWLLLWILFRLIFSSALVKWNSGDVSWRDLTALDYHFWTQPLPHIGGWFVAHFPEGLLRGMTFGMFVTEFGAPFLLLGPRNFRLAGAVLIAILQLLIALTGNYGFFNLLTSSLCVLAVDDASWPQGITSWWSKKRRALPRTGTSVIPSRQSSFFILITASLLFVISSMTLPLESIPRPMPLLFILEVISPFHIVNGYGLFAVMTKQREEIIVEGSEDGLLWRPYDFRFKPGDPLRMPPVLPLLLMPRLDWQMWFAALAPAGASPWFDQFLLRLSQGDRAVLHLLRGNPFPKHPPRYLRARLEDEHFSSAAEWLNMRIWWNAVPAGIYYPEVQIKPR